MGGRKGNAAEGVSLPITLSRQAVDALNQIAARGIFGRNANEVAARFVDEALQKVVQFSPITLKIDDIPQE